MNISCRHSPHYMGVYGYADDITLLYPTVSMVSHRGHNCISSALTILDSALTS